MFYHEKHVSQKQTQGLQLQRPVSLMYLHHLKTFFYYFRPVREFMFQIKGRFYTTARASVFAIKTGVLFKCNRKRYSRHYQYYFAQTSNRIGAYGLKM